MVDQDSVPQDSVAREETVDISAAERALNSNPYGANDAAVCDAVDDTTESQTTHRWEQQRSYGFEVGRHRLLVEQGRYCELLTHYQVAALPNAPEHFLGLTNVRGNLIPVYQLASLLGGEGEKCSYALVIGNLPNAAALAISKKPVQFNLNGWQPVEIPEDIPDLLRFAVTCSHVEDGRIWSTIDHESLFRYLAGAL